MLVGYIFVKNTLSPVKTNHAKYLMQINMVKPLKLVYRKKNQQRRLEHRLRNSFSPNSHANTSNKDSKFSHGKITTTYQKHVPQTLYQIFVSLIRMPYSNILKSCRILFNIFHSGYYLFTNIRNVTICKTSIYFYMNIYHAYETEQYS